ncbi:hypothetical protein GALMADRAFT_217157 [Galerina marginata CBS 339.88]|uniref:F-box domain-containing protein n=1 Tax=Galerina marginata (strain CBS 339.88) TaxID=685588 RepID=A0A067S635_GALM3|nr:hypothetical protein GALMADRAFT_217157 [Galerina marginata CBS 339.88]
MPPINPRIGKSPVATKILGRTASMPSKTAPENWEGIVTNPPINRLPIEILWEIFSAVIPYQLSCARNIAILRLCWVSSQWRRTAMGLSSIWASLTIPLPEITSYLPDLIDEESEFWGIVDQWFQRAGNLPLSLDLVESPDCSHDPSVRCFPCLQLLRNAIRKYSDKVHHLEGVTPHLLQRISKHHFENLHSLILDVDYHDVSRSSLLSLPSFAPNLRRLSLDRVFDTTLENVQASIRLWNDLTHVTTRISGLRTLLEILRACPYLQSAVFHYDNHSRLQATHLQDIKVEFANPVVLPCLITLTIVLSKDESLSLTVFRFLEMPALTSFRLGSFHQPEFGFDSPRPQDLTYIYRQMRNLRRLSLIFNALSRRGLMELLLQLPNLEELDLQDCIDIGNFFSDLNRTQETSTTPFLPWLRLVTLDFREVPESNLDNFHLSTFFLARLRPDVDEYHWDNSFRIKIFMSGKAAQVYRPLVRKGKRKILKGIPIEFIFWDRNIGSRGNRWKFRLDSEDEKPLHGTRRAPFSIRSLTAKIAFYRADAPGSHVTTSISKRHQHFVVYHVPVEVVFPFISLLVLDLLTVYTTQVNMMLLIMVFSEQAPFTSVFEPYTGTNYIPTELEGSRIREIILEPEKIFAKIEDDIMRLQLVMDKVKKEKQGLQDVVDNHRGLLSPFRRLPNDILVAVFLFCLPESNNAIMDINEPPLLLGRICRRWQFVAYHTPRLWATLHVPVPNYPYPDDEAHYPKSHGQVLSEFWARLSLHQVAVKEWLSRSGLCPLSLSFHPTAFEVGQPIGHYQPYLDILHLFSHRWRHVELTIPDGEYSSFFSSITAHEVPMLCTLHVTFLRPWVAWDNTHDPKWENSGLLNAKNLQNLCMSGFPFPISQIAAQLSKLTRLELTDSSNPWQEGGLHITETHKLLSQCSNLVHCAIHITDGGGPICPTEAIDLPFLQSMEVVAQTYSLDFLFQCFRTPFLRFVRYHATSRPSSRCRSSLLTLLSRSQSQIEGLTTNVELLTLQDLQECFKLTPSLRRFRNEEYRRGFFYGESTSFNVDGDTPIDLVKTAFEFLIPDEDGHCSWPRLTEIDLAHPCHVSDQDVYRFITRRIERAKFGDVMSLKKVKVDFKHELECGIQTSLLQYAELEEEIKLEFTYSKEKVVYPGTFKYGKTLPRYSFNSDTGFAHFTSVFGTHTGTNYIPTELERNQIEDITVKPEKLSAKIKDDLMRLQLVVGQMTKQKLDLRDVIDKHRRLLSPVRRLPDDILAAVFLFCLPDSHNAVMDKNDSPLLLGRVCKHWRNVAYRTPLLWATLHLPFPIPPANQGGDAHSLKAHDQLMSEFEAKSLLHRAAIKQWLLRSGSCPLSLSFHPTAWMLGRLVGYYQPYFEILLLFSRRWWRVEMSLRTDEYSSFFTSLSAEDVPLLQSLRIGFLPVWTLWNKPHDLNWEKSGLFKSKNLRALCMSGFPCPVQHLTIQWSKLTCLELTNSQQPWHDQGMDIPKTHDLLSQCSNLVHCALHITGLAGQTCPPGLINFPFLESLDILDRALFLEALFHCLQTPSLRFVKYHTVFWPSSQRRSPLLALLSNTQGRVEGLTTNVEFMTVQELQECFELTPSLRRFRNEQCIRGAFHEQSQGFNKIADFPIDFVKSAFRFLIPDEDGRCYWPRLTEIDLNHARRIDDQDVLLFVARRMELSKSKSDVIRLKTVKANFKHEMVHDIQSAVSRYTDSDVEGRLKLDFTYPSDRAVRPGYYRYGKTLRRSPLLE